MSTPKQTPLPWHSVKYQSGEIVIYDADQRGVCRLSPYQDDYEHHCEIIKHRVNMHDDLVKALDKMLTNSRHFEDTQEHLCFLKEKEFEDMHALLHHAKEGQ